MIRFVEATGVVEVECPPLDGNLLASSLAAGVKHYHACGGKGHCSTCRVMVLEGIGNFSARSAAPRKETAIEKTPCNPTRYCYFISCNMAVNTQFAVAVHVMSVLGYAEGKDITTSILAGSVNTSPSFVRRVVARLSKAGLIETEKGKMGACRLGRKARKISLLEIYRAVEAPKAFAIHAHAVEPRCPVSRNFKGCFGNTLARTQKAFERSLEEATLADVVNDVRAADSRR